MHAYICREEFITASYKMNSNDNINIIFKTDLKRQNSIGIGRLVLVLTKFRCWDVILKYIVGSHQIANSIHIFLTTFPLRGPGGGWRGGVSGSYPRCFQPRGGVQRGGSACLIAGQIYKNRRPFTPTVCGHGESTEKPVVVVEATVLISAQPKQRHMEKH